MPSTSRPADSRVTILKEPSRSRSASSSSPPVHPDASRNPRKHHEPSRSGNDGRSDSPFAEHRGTVTRLHTASKLSAVPENITSVPYFNQGEDNRTQTRSSRHHDDDRTQTRSSRHHDDRTQTRSSRNHQQDSQRTIRASDHTHHHESQRTVRASDSVTCSNHGELVLRDPPHGQASRQLALREPSQVPRQSYDSRASTAIKDRTVARTSSTRAGKSSSTRELEHRVAQLESEKASRASDKAAALEQKVRDLEGRLEDMHLNNAMQHSDIERQNYLRLRDETITVDRLYLMYRLRHYETMWGWY